MADIAVVWDQGCGSLQLNGADLLTDNSLLTAVIISLFTDRRALDSDEIPDGTRDRRGWWETVSGSAPLAPVSGC